MDNELFLVVARSHDESERRAVVRPSTNQQTEFRRHIQYFLPLVKIFVMMLGRSILKAWSARQLCWRLREVVLHVALIVYQRKLGKKYYRLEGAQSKT